MSRHFPAGVSRCETDTWTLFLSRGYDHLRGCRLQLEDHMRFLLPTTSLGASSLCPGRQAMVKAESTMLVAILTECLWSNILPPVALFSQPHYRRGTYCGSANLGFKLVGPLKTFAGGSLPAQAISTWSPQAQPYGQPTHVRHLQSRTSVQNATNRWSLQTDFKRHCGVAALRRWTSWETVGDPSR